MKEKTKHFQIKIESLTIMYYPPFIFGRNYSFLKIEKRDR